MDSCGCDKSLDKEHEIHEKEGEGWERVLWKNQPYPDNYIGPDFFRVTKKRLRVTAVEAVLGCMPVTQEISSCLYMVSVFCGLSSSLVLPSSVLLVTACYVALRHLRNRPDVSVLPVCGVTVCVCGGLCHVLQSLTASVATDTVYACTTLLLLLHVMLHDYGNSVPVANETLSHNVGVFACVCLASRLVGYWSVFAFSVSGIAVFARQEVKSAPPSPASVVTETSVVCGVTCASLYLYVPALLPLYVSAVLLANVALPLLYVRLQRYRLNIYGPWDEARLDSY